MAEAPAASQVPPPTAALPVDVVGGWFDLPCDLLVSILAFADLQPLASMLAVCTDWHRAAAHQRCRRREITANARSDLLLASMRAVGISAHPTRSLLAGQVTALTGLEMHFQRRESHLSEVDLAVVDGLVELLPSTVPHLRTLHLHSMLPAACLKPLLSTRRRRTADWRSSTWKTHKLVNRPGPRMSNRSARSPTVCRC